jgi:hypothetical protein
MRERGLTPSKERLQTQRCDAVRTGARKSTLCLRPRAWAGTPMNEKERGNRSDVNSPQSTIELRKSSCPSRRTASYRRHDRLIREEIIGHRMRIARRMDGPRIGARLRVRSAQCMFALLHKPARQHGGGVFFQPGIEQLADLLAEIRGVTEPRELIALEGVSRS